MTLQTEQEYIRILKSRLEGVLPRDELDDLLSDYSEHFRIGKSSGRTEDDLCRSLGSPDDVAREVKATHFVNKAESTRSCGNIFHAVIATLGLGLFNLVFVLVPFIVIVALLVVIFLLGVAFAIFGPAAFILSILQILGIPAFAIWQSPAAGTFFSIGITTFGLLLIAAAFYLARFFYHLGIRYLKWNIRIIRGTEDLS
ncbi:HAAS signaling domain-containing protein [uncultured Methanoregula sp.]|uniref:HAAS signaling domain-containing protein n=1 Tax=uncultured Methanoregula sp. TaxID=1005933 RepID=UPI002AAC0ADA|nr:DUF1700 domain-containing protein [uncultured Methanoregula sp.]